MPGRLLETLPLQRRRPGQQLVEDHAKGVDVRPRVHVEVVELGLFRTHVQRRAQQHAVGRVQRALGERLLDRLGQPEVDHFRHRLAVVQADQDVAGLQVSVDHALGVGVLHGLADRHEERETLGDAQAGVVAILGEGDALDVLHDEERPAALGRAAVEHLGDVRVVHQGQGLPLRLEPRQDGPRVHPRLDELQRHDSPNRLRLLGLPDRAHPPCANLLEQPVAAGDHGADAARPREHRRGPIPAVTSVHPGGLADWSRMPRVFRWAASNCSTRCRSATSPAHASSRKACRSAAVGFSRAATNSDSSFIAPAPASRVYGHMLAQRWPKSHAE